MMKQSFRIAGLGEVWWDVFPDQIHFGGAAANYACRAQDIGWTSVIGQLCRTRFTRWPGGGFFKQRQVDTSTVAQSSSTQRAGPDNTV